MLFLTLFLATFVSRCFFARTDQQLELLESRLNKELNKTESDIKELKEMINGLKSFDNETCKCIKLGYNNRTLEGMPTLDSFPDGTKVNEEINKEIDRIYNYIEKNSKSLMDEFEKKLTVLRDEHKGILGKVDTNTRAIGRIKKNLAGQAKEDTVDISKVTKNSDIGIEKLENKLSVIDDTVSDFREDMRSLDRMLMNLDTLIRQVDKKTVYIREDIDRNDLIVANMDLQLVEMDKRYDEFVRDLNQFKEEMKREIEGIVATFKRTELKRTYTARTCPISWIRNGNKCYLYDKETGDNWATAVSTCNSLGAKLAEPDSTEELDFLKGFVHGWIGASDINTEGVFMWKSTDTPVGDLPWWPGMPDNYGNNQDCLVLWGSMINDEECSKRYRYVCEKQLE